MKITASAAAVCMMLAMAGGAVAHAQSAVDSPSTNTKKFGDPSGERRLGFSIVLLLGDTKGSGATVDTLPIAARKALSDVKDFLPYKDYKLLDAQWVLCCGGGPVMTRLSGPDGREYAANMDVTREGPKLEALGIRFLLMDVGGTDTKGAPGGRAIENVEADLKALAIEREDLQRRYRANDPRVVKNETLIRTLEAELAKLQGRAAADVRRPVMEASFKIAVGETVVVGTSRLRGGDRALIAILTAAPQGGGKDR